MWYMYTTLNSIFYYIKKLRSNWDRTWDAACFGWCGLFFGATALASSWTSRPLIGDTSTWQILVKLDDSDEPCSDQKLLNWLTLW